MNLMPSPPLEPPRKPAPMALLGRVREALTAKREPVIPPYTVQRTPLEHAIRRTKLFAVIVVIGMLYGFFFALLPPAFLLFLAAPIGVLILAVIWALPDRDTAPPAQAMEKLFFGFSVALMIWPVYLAVKLPGLPYITLVRIFTAPATLLLLISVSTSQAFREQMKAVLSESPWITRLMIALVALQIGTVAFSGEPVGTVKKVVDAQFEWTAMFFAGVFIFLRPGRALLWSTLLCASVAYVCAIGVAEFVEQGVIWGQHVPALLKIEDESIRRTLEGAVRSAIGTHRLQSIFVHSLVYAEFLGVTAPFVLHFMITARSMLIRAAMLLLLPLMVFVLIGSQSRLGMGTFMLSVLFYMALWAYRRWRRNRSDLLGPSIVFAFPIILSAFIAATFFVGRLRNLVWGNGAQAASDESRMDQLSMAIPLIGKWPFGYGLGRGGIVLGYTDTSGLLTIDSYWLSMLLDLGILGFFAFYGLFVVGAVKAFRASAVAESRETALLTPLSISLFVFILIKAVLSQDQNHAILFMMLGMVVALVYRVNRDVERRTRGAIR